MAEDNHRDREKSKEEPLQELESARSRVLELEAALDGMDSSGPGANPTDLPTARAVRNLAGARLESSDMMGADLRVVPF